MDNGRKTIKGFQDLEVYHRLYEAMLITLKEIVPKLPKEEQFDLKDQMRRCCKSAPALVSEGFAKRYQKKNWKKYIEDATGECNEMIHHLSVCKDIYYDFVGIEICLKLISEYDISCKQLSALKSTWINYHSND